MVIKCQQAFDIGGKFQSVNTIKRPHVPPMILWTHPFDTCIINVNNLVHKNYKTYYYC